MTKTERKKVGRPKDRDRKNVSLYMDEASWELLGEKAKSLGLTKSALVEKIALSEQLDKELLGELFAS